MKKLLSLILLLILLIQPVAATEFTAPEVPDAGQQYMPEDTESFAEGLWFVLKSAIASMKPSIIKAATVCMSTIAIMMLTSLLHNVSSKAQQVTQIVAALGCGLLLTRSANTLIHLGTDTVTTLSEYGKLLIPVLSAATAAQGGISASTAIYTGTTLFSAVLTSLIGKLIVPMIYVYICLGLANCAIGEQVLKKLRDFVKWLMTWSLKIVLYVFTGYISITGVIGGSADASMIKATKLAISGSVPVIGGILSDASESILISAGIMKNSAGIYGVLAIVATWIGPFLEVGVQYLMLKLTAAICSVIGNQRMTELVQDFSISIGFVLATISTISLLLLIGVVCFLKGVS